MDRYSPTASALAPRGASDSPVLASVLARRYVSGTVPVARGPPPSGDLGRSGHGRSSHLGPHAPGGRASRSAVRYPAQKVSN